MNMNVFTWIREGIKQSVLLGFSDAFEQIGTPPNSEELSPVMLEFMQSQGESAGPKRLSSTTTSRPKKRLGRSLKDLDGASSDAKQPAAQ